MTNTFETLIYLPLDHQAPCLPKVTTLLNSVFNISLTVLLQMYTSLITVIANILSMLAPGKTLLNSLHTLPLILTTTIKGKCCYYHHHWAGEETEAQRV